MNISLTMCLYKAYNKENGFQTAENTRWWKGEMF